MVIWWRVLKINSEPQKSWAEIAKSKTHSSILSSENDRSPKFSHGIPSTSNGFKKNGDINGNGDYGNGMVDDDHRPRSVASSSSGIYLYIYIYIFASTFLV